MKRRPLLFASIVLFLTLASAIACAATFVTFMVFALPPTDAAYHDPLVLLDPFVLTIAIPVATGFGLAIYPIALFTLWRRDLLRSGLVVFATTLVAIAIATPLCFLYAIPIAAGVAIVCLIFCRVTTYPFLRQRFGPTSMS